jgi:membrane fusion protein, macrolide-specific efflux system
VRSEAQVQITSGLTEGEQVVLSTPTLGSTGGGAGPQRIPGGLGGGGGGGAIPGGGGGGAVVIPGGGGR